MTPRFQAEVLAPTAGGMRSCLSKVKTQIVSRYHALRQNLKRAVESLTRRLPQSSPVCRPDTGDTAIHKAIAHADRLAEEANYGKAAILLYELARDMRHAQQVGTIVPLMEKWNRRYPSNESVGPTEANLAAILEVVEKRLDQYVEHLDDNDRLERRVQEAFDRLIHQGWLESEYETPVEFLLAYAEAMSVQSTFDVHIAEPLRDCVDGVASLKLAMTGLTAVYRIIAELQDRFPKLRERDWTILIDGRSFESSDQLVLPGENLAIVPPRVAPHTPAPGPWGGALGMLATVFAFMNGVSRVSAVRADIAPPHGTTAITLHQPTVHRAA